MRKYSFFVRYFATFAFAGVLGFASTTVYADSTGSQRGKDAVAVQSLEALSQLLAGADVVVLGEVHDNPHHHGVQAKMITRLQPKAVVWEMITQEQAETLTEDLLGDAAATAEALDWAASGWPDFDLYAPVFRASSQAQHFGALVPRGEGQAALQAGVADHFGAEATRFGLDQPLPQAEQAAREADQLANHCNAMPAEMLPMMVDFQRLRDAQLAAAAERAWQQTGGAVVVITGNGHARKDRGLPVYLQNAAPDIRLVSLGQMEQGQISGDFDVTYTSPAAARPDPCQAFSKSE